MGRRTRTDSGRTPLTRRRFLGWAAGAAAAALVPLPALADTGWMRRISFYNTHTGERLSCVYWADGYYLPGALRDINFILRDHRNNEIKEMDPKLLDLLSALRKKLECNKPFDVISGYRSPQTNQMLYEQGAGVAKHSLHIVGKAADIRLAGIGLKTLRKAAVALKLGGVGYYPQARFIHVDTGRIRYW